MISSKDIAQKRSSSPQYKSSFYALLSSSFPFVSTASHRSMTAATCALSCMQEQVHGSQPQTQQDTRESNGTLASKDDEEKVKDDCFIFAWRKLLKDKLQTHRYGWDRGHVHFTNMPMSLLSLPFFWYQVNVSCMQRLVTSRKTWRRRFSITRVTKQLIRFYAWCIHGYVDRRAK